MDLSWLHENLPDIPRTVYEGNWQPDSNASMPPQHRTVNGNGKEGQVHTSSVPCLEKPCKPTHQLAASV